MPPGLRCCGGLRDQIGVEFVAFFAAEESDFGFVVADFARERWRFAAADVRRIADDEVEVDIATATVRTSRARANWIPRKVMRSIGFGNGMRSRRATLRCATSRAAGEMSSA